MTFAELLAMPKGMGLDEYGKLLDSKHRLIRKIRRASDTIFDEEASLEILADEVGSERYNRHLENKKKAEANIVKAKAKLEQIEKKLNA